MKTNEELIREYAKKIYGFAYSKTGNPSDADDLSQEIVLSLCTIPFAEKQIGNMDAYIFRVCQYTWAKFLRKNKTSWECIGTDDYLDFLEFPDDTEEEAAKQELYEKLRREIMYLGKVRREAIILFYYDGKSGEEISEAFGIPAATVRWHLHSAKKELKERIEMNEQDTIFRPVRLSIGHYGWQDNDVMRQLETDTLMQNICFVCFNNAMTVEEISRTLGVAAVYLEDKLDKLVSMEYMTISAKGKYLTNFFIRDVDYQLAHSNYQYEKTPPLAEAYYTVVKSAFTEIKTLGFIGADISDDILMWDIILYFMMRETGNIDNRMIEKLHLEHGAPIRPDGTKHWLRGEVIGTDTEKAKEAGDEGFYDFYKNARNFSVRSLNLTPSNIHGLKLDSPFVSGFCYTWNPFGEKELLALRRIRELICGAEINDFDKAAVADLIEKGYVARIDGKLKALIPYFNKEQKQSVDRILGKYADKLLNREANLKLFIGYAEHMKKLIPTCVCENERNHYLTSYDPHNAVLWHLMNKGLLKEPSEAERKYICTVMWDI